MSDLRHTVEVHPNILEVFFTSEGQYYFTAYDYQGTKYGQFMEGSPILSTRIVEIKTREEVLGLRRNFDTTDKQDFVDEQSGKSKRNRK
jgi:hypothetical protein